MDPIYLIDKTKVYQFIKDTKSRNTTDKLKKVDDIISFNRLLLDIEKWMNWHKSTK